MNDSLCFELAKGLPAAFVALVVGGIAAFIAYRQYEVSKAKVKLDLFDKRYAIFTRTWEELSALASKGAGPDALTDFTNIIPQAGFLFGTDIEAYLRTISEKRTALWTIENVMRSRGNVMAPEDVDRHTELTHWFLEEASKGAKRVFDPWLSFEKWR